MCSISFKICLVAVFVFCFVSAGAAEQKYLVTEGFYISPQVSYLSLGGGDFDGETLLIGADEILFIPDVSPGVGFGGTFGYRDGATGYEIGLIFSTLDSSFGTIESDSSLVLIPFRFKWFLNDASEFQPYLSLGADLDFLTFHDGAATVGPPIMVGDAKYLGVSLSVGGGMLYYISSNIAFFAGVDVRFMLFTSAEGYYEESYSLDESVYGTMLDVNAGFTILF